MEVNDLTMVYMVLGLSVVTLLFVFFGLKPMVRMAQEKWFGYGRVLIVGKDRTMRFYSRKMKGKESDSIEDKRVLYDGDSSLRWDNVLTYVFPNNSPAPFKHFANKEIDDIQAVYEQAKAARQPVRAINYDRNEPFSRVPADQLEALLLKEKMTSGLLHILKKFTTLAAVFIGMAIGVGVNLLLTFNLQNELREAGVLGLFLLIPRKWLKKLISLR